MNKPLYRFDFAAAAGGDRWTREFRFASNDAAMMEGRLLLETQAVLRPLTEMRLAVSRAPHGEMHRLGTWVWAEKAAIWHPAGNGPRGILEKA